MTLIAFIALLVTAHFGALESKPAVDTDAIITTTGRFVIVVPGTGEHLSLHKEDIRKLDNDEIHHLRFTFDNELPHLDMRVTQDSVWDKDSVLEVLKDSNTEIIPHELDESCFLRGRLVDPEGGVTFVRCGKITGSMQTDDHHYRIEEHEMPEVEDTLSHTVFRVTKKKHKSGGIDEEYRRETMDKLKQQIAHKMADLHNNGTIRRKREVMSPTIELIAYVDADYVQYMSGEMGFDNRDMMLWIINKWNDVENALSDVNEVGAVINIALRKIKLWVNNPSGYPGQNVGMNRRLDWFCDETPSSANFDSKVLYTKNTAGHQEGLAYTGLTCRDRLKCFVIKSPTQRVKVELHEFGHTLGLLHDPDIVGGCGPVEGFMGWTDTYRFLPCYKNVLLDKFSHSSFDCLFERNVRHDQVARFLRNNS